MHTPSMSTIRLFDVEPDLARFLSSEDRDTVRQLRLPVVDIAPGEANVRELLEPERGFGGIVIDGMILQSLRLGEHPGLRLIGPGDVLSLTSTPASMLVLDGSCRVTSATRIALLGREFLLAARRWPWLIAGLHARSGEQAERLTTQLMICQLPRVDDRLLAMMWLLAESWGQVTGCGTVLPVELTHSALGGLIGARRPTVTLALSELTERGALVRQRDGWLLLEPPKATALAKGEAVGEPRLLAAARSVWGEGDRRGAPEPPGRTDALHYAALRETVGRLRAEHTTRAAETRQRLSELRASRAAVLERRRRFSSQPPRQPAPSS